MTPEEIATILAQHAEWLRDTSKGARANLHGADLSGADLDFAAWPLWCGSLQVALDERQQAQLLYHVLAVSPVARKLATPEMLAFANGSHVVEECDCERLTNAATT